MHDPTDDIEEGSERSETRLWLGLSLLTWSVIASCLLHGSVLIPAFMDVFRPSEADIDLEWLKSFDSLEGLGHGSSGRFAELDEASFHTKAEGEKLPEPEPVVEEPPPPEPEPEPKPETKSEEPQARPKPQKAKSEEPEVTSKKPIAAKPTTPREVFSEGELPGLDRAGPNGLPAMEGYGPGNAVFTALVRLDRIRGTQFEEPTRKLLEQVPDYRIVLQGTEIDPVRDLDSMFMASADPVYVEETFLAVRHRLGSDELRRRLDNRYVTKAPWTEERGIPARDLVPAGARYTDPRKILVPRKNLALIVRPEWISQLTNALPKDSKLMQGVDTGSLERAPSMLDGLTYIERAAGESDTVILMSAMGARVGIPGVGRLNFEGAKIEIAGIDAPRLTIDLTLATEDEARRFAEACPSLKRRILNEVPFIARSITRMVIERLSCEQTENYVAIAGKYTAEEAQRLMNIALPFVPRPPELAYLPPAPPRQPVDVPSVPADEGQPANEPDKPAEDAAPSEPLEAPNEPATSDGDQQDGGEGQKSGQDQNP